MKTFSLKKWISIRGCGQALAGFISLVLVTSCVSWTSQKTSDQQGAMTGSGSSFSLPPFEEKLLANGLKIIYVTDRKLPYVSFSLMVKGGASLDPKNKSGLSSFVAELLDKGTAKMSATQIAQTLDQMGADFSSSASKDYFLVNASSLASQSDRLLDVLGSIVKDPSFSAGEVERARRNFIARIKKRVDDADDFADLAWMSYLFGDHSYARPISGTLKSIGHIRRKNIIQHYLRFFRPNNALLAVTGQYSDEFKQKLEKSFGAWENRPLASLQQPHVEPPQGLRIQLVDKPGLVQTQIRMGHLGISRSNKDYLVLRLANTILGGAFASRLMDRVRKDLGLTYSISSGFDSGMDLGSFDISTFTKNQTVGQTIAEVLKTFKLFKEQGITQVELDRAKGYMKGLFPRSIETAEKLAFNLLILRLYGVDDKYLINFISDVDALSLTEVNRAIGQYFDPENLKILVYSNATEVSEQLKPIAPVELKKAATLF